MSPVIVVGAQWGDEGKGKLVDCLAESAGLVVRFNGSSNLGHTVFSGSREIVFRTMPCGILHPQIRALVTPGVAVDPFVLYEELTELNKTVTTINTKRFGLSPLVQMILPYHTIHDRVRSSNSASSGNSFSLRVGSSLVHEWKIAGLGLCLEEALNLSQCTAQLHRQYDFARWSLGSAAEGTVFPNPGEVAAALKKVVSELKPYFCDTSAEIHDFTSKGQRVIFEGAKGSLVDVYFGGPATASSPTVAGSVYASGGLSPAVRCSVVGAVKAYVSAPSKDVIVVQMPEDIQRNVRERGREVGTVTKSPRVCGWLDFEATRKGLELHRATDYIITKVDGLDEVQRIKFIGGKNGVKCREADGEVDGWLSNTRSVRSWSDLPIAAKQYIGQITSHLAAEPVLISTGPKREETILLPGFKKLFKD